MALKTILFDMGNVLVYFSHDRMCEQIAQICGTTAEEIRAAVFASELQWNFERGRLSEEQLQAQLMQHFQTDIDLDQLRWAIGDIFEPNDAIVPILAQLKQRGLRLVLMSNTCVTHLNHVRSNYSHLDYFDDFVVSYEVGAIKPEEGMYLAALNKIQCAPQECFFTDDIPQYVEIARNHGIQAEVYTDVPSLRGQLSQRRITLFE